MGEWSTRARTKPCSPRVPRSARTRTSVASSERAPASSPRPAGQPKTDEGHGAPLKFARIHFCFLTPSVRGVNYKCSWGKLNATPRFTPIYQQQVWRGRAGIGGARRRRQGQCMADGTEGRCGALLLGACRCLRATRTAGWRAGAEHVALGHCGCRKREAPGWRVAWSRCKGDPICASMPLCVQHRLPGALLWVLRGGGLCLVAGSTRLVCGTERQEEASGRGRASCWRQGVVDGRALGYVAFSVCRMFSQCFTLLAAAAAPISSKQAVCCASTSACAPRPA